MKLILLTAVILLTIICGSARPCFGVESAVLARELKDLYVFHTYEQAKSGDESSSLQIVLTANSYQGDLRIDQVLSPDIKYVIYIGNEQRKIIRTFEVYFGGASQYALNVSGEENVFVGRVGEYLKGSWFKAYAGLRADPAFYDREGLREFIDKRCSPKLGFRCSEEATVENFYQNKNVLAIVLSLNSAGVIPAGVKSAATTYTVWAKAFKKHD